MCRVFVLLGVTAVFSMAAEPLTEQRVVTVNQSEANFRIVERNVSARSVGVFVILGGAGAGEALAVDRLVKKAQLNEGTSRALVNLVVDKRIIFFLVGAATIITARADVVEFTATEGSK